LYLIRQYLYLYLYLYLYYAVLDPSLPHSNYSRYTHRFRNAPNVPDRLTDGRDWSSNTPHYALKCIGRQKPGRPRKNWIATVHQDLKSIGIRDSNPGPIFSIPGFRIGEFLIPGSRDPGGITGSRQYDIKNLYY